jgi:multidrug efflux system outer membrane protein
MAPASTLIRAPSQRARAYRASIPAVLILMACGMVITGCAALPATPENLPAVPAAFKEADTRTHAAPPAMMAGGAWWKLFADPVLDELVVRALSGNTSIQIAAAKLNLARAAARSAGASRMPQAGLNAGVSRQGGPLINAAGGDGTLFNVGANLSFELDLAGRLSKAAEAATLDAQSREALLYGARLLIQADVVQNYMSLRHIDAERAMVRGIAQVQRESLRLTERRQNAGLAPELDSVRARAELASTEAEALALDRRRAELEHAIALLVGETASTFNLASADWKVDLPDIPPGIPSAVLVRRPDISAAQRSMAAAQARLGIAHKAWFPNLSLTSSGGFASAELGDLLRFSSRAWNIGSLLSLPLFDGGRRDAAIQNARADLELALATYREQILVAFKEVEDQLSTLRLLSDQAQALSSAMDAAGRATVLSESRYQRGLASQIDLLDARRSELRNRRAALVVNAQRYQATAALVRALGGGWGDATAGAMSQGAALNTNAQ